MTSNFYQTLSLPSNPLLPSAIETLRNNKIKGREQGDPYYQIAYYNCNEVLTEETLNVFDTLGVTPFYVVHFGSLNNHITQTYLHTDLFWTEDRYQTVPFGINWNLTSGTTTFRWYDAGDIPEAWPPHKMADFQGIHYGQRYSKSIEGCEELGSLSIEQNTAYLLKTDIPHRVTYTCDEPLRYGVSVRFKLEDIPTWDQALKVFEPLFLAPQPGLEPGTYGLTVRRSTD